MLKYYHNPKCSKSREGLKLLEASGKNFEIIEYLKNPPTQSDLLKLFQKIGLEPSKCIRIKEQIYKDLKLKEKNLNPKQWAKTIFENPILLERPILESQNKAIIGRPPELMKDLI